MLLRGSISKRFFVFVLSGQLPYNLLASQNIFTFAIPLMFRPVNTSCVCVVFFFSQEECQNYIRVLLVGGDRLFTCGTNAFTPVCTNRTVSLHLEPRQNLIPGKPKHSVKAILLHVFLFSKELFFKSKKKSFFSN